MSKKGPLLRGVHIWKDEDTGKELQAPCALRWEDVELMQQFVESETQRWEYSGPVTCLLCNGLTYHLLGKFEKWLLKWEAHENSQPPYLLFAN